MIIAWRGKCVVLAVFLALAGCRGSDKATVKQQVPFSAPMSLAEDPQLLAAVSGRLVEISVRKPNGASSQCLGYIESESYVMTAGHCLANLSLSACGNKSISMSRLVVTLDGRRVVERAEPLHCRNFIRSGVRDLARIALAAPAGIAQQRGSVISEGPVSNVVWRDGSGALVFSRCTEFQYPVVPVFTEAQTLDVRAHTCSSLPGTSGSPIFIREGDAGIPKWYGIHLGAIEYSGEIGARVAKKGLTLNPGLRERIWNYFQFATSDLYNFAYGRIDEFPTLAPIPQNLPALLGEEISNMVEAFIPAGIDNADRSFGIFNARNGDGEPFCVATYSGGAEAITSEHCEPVDSQIRWANGGGTSAIVGSRSSRSGMRTLVLQIPPTGAQGHVLDPEEISNAPVVSVVVIKISDGTLAVGWNADGADSCRLENGVALCKGVPQKQYANSGAPVFVEGRFVGVYNGDRSGITR